MNRIEKFDKCTNFFNELARALSDKYEVVGSCNNDASAYLIPNGTEKQITYYGKPDLSFRISDHWNWYANVRKCKNRKYVQCYSLDLPRPKRRLAKDKASKPISASQVAIIGPDGNYHHIYGEKWNGVEWTWVENKVDDVIRLYLNGGN